MGSITVGIYGGTGYTGWALIQLLIGHPEVTIRFVTSERLAGKSLNSTWSLAPDITLQAAAEVDLQQVDCVFLCLPHTHSAKFAANAKKAASKAKKAEEIMHSKTHQDLINAAYKAAEELKIAPWVLLRAAEWGHFTDDRGKKYDGPMIDDIETLDDAQKKALKKVLEL